MKALQDSENLEALLINITFKPGQEKYDFMEEIIKIKMPKTISCLDFSIEQPCHLEYHEFFINVLQPLENIEKLKLDITKVICTEDKYTPLLQVFETMASLQKLAELEIINFISIYTLENLTQIMNYVYQMAFLQKISLKIRGTDTGLKSSNLEELASFKTSLKNSSTIKMLKINSENLPICTSVVILNSFSLLKNAELIFERDKSCCIMNELDAIQLLQATIKSKNLIYIKIKSILLKNVSTILQKIPTRSTEIISY